MEIIEFVDTIIEAYRAAELQNCKTEAAKQQLEVDCNAWQEEIRTLVK